MWVIRLTGCAVCVLAVIATGTAIGASHHPDSGIRGHVLYGPTCPVQRPGQNCERPYQATITVKREPDGAIVKRVHSDRDGRFTTFLRAGRYLLVPRNGRPYPRAQSQSVVVHGHRFTAVTIHFDSGIR
jgi:hypothetical protein